MENLGLVSLFIVLIVSAYYLGVKKGMHAPFSFNVIEPDVVVMFDGAPTRNETIRLIQQEFVEKRRLEKKLKSSEDMINKFQWAFYHLCDSMHNIGIDYVYKETVDENELRFKTQVSNANIMLSYARIFFNKDVLKNDMAYVALIQFLENDLNRNVAGDSEASFREKLNALYEKFAKSILEDFQLEKPEIVKTVGVNKQIVSPLFIGEVYDGIGTITIKDLEAILHEDARKRYMGHQKMIDMILGRNLN